MASLAMCGGMSTEHVDEVRDVGEHGEELVRVERDALAEDLALLALHVAELHRGEQHLLAPLLELLFSAHCA